MFNLDTLTEDQLSYLEHYYGIAVPHATPQDASNILSTFIGPVRVNDYWLQFLKSKKKTKCLQCKKFMPRIPQEMILVVTFEWHVHIKCMGKLLDKLEKEE